jgi:enoyl-CoA hydratase
MTEPILLDVDSGVALITLNAPERRNALVPEMIRCLLDVCDTVDADDSVGSAVLKADGLSFCAGAHRALLAQIGKDPARPDNYRDLELTYRAFIRVSELRVPTVAAVRGHAVGAGVNLMLATDLRVVAETAQIATGFLRIGLHPGGGHFGMLSRLSGREAAAAMSLFGQRIDGRRAVELGIAWEALPEPEVESRAIEIAQECARDPELARAMVRTFRSELGPPAVSWAIAAEMEKGPQMWSLRRSEDAANEREHG